MNHAYYLSEDLDELETMHDDLVNSGIPDKHIHVLSEHEADVEQHHMRNMNPFLKTNVLRALTIGAITGLILGLIMMAVPFLFGFEASMGSIPFTLGGLFLLGFATWEGGFLGLQKVHPKFSGIIERLHHGKHLMIVDYHKERSQLLNSIGQIHPKLESVKL